MIKVRQTTTYYTALNSIIKTEDGYVGVGFSDFKHSDFNKYQEKGYNKPCLWVYDKNLNIFPLMIHPCPLPPLSYIQNK